MTEPTAPARDYRSTVFLPKTDFPMKAGLPQKEPGILARWLDGDLYRQLREARAGREKFILHDGPPYANGDMHIGHALNHILKDMVVRTQNLLGKDAPYVPGWDCHGLPIEWKVEEQYRKQKLDKDQVPVLEFRAECRAYAQGWVDKQREQLKRLGINGDWDNPYLTMDPQAEGTIVGELMKFAESGQLYRGAKPVMWSPVEKTALAEAEVEYEDIVSTQIDVAFEIVECPNEPGLMGAWAVIWTTTPWTIPVNQALAYGPDIEYVALNVSIDCGDPQADKLVNDDASLATLDQGIFVVARDLVPAFSERVRAQVARCIPGLDNVEIEFAEAHTFKGVGFEGAVARHPMYDLTEVNVGPKGFFRTSRPFLPGDFVTNDSGTGLVHMAPDHGEDDFALCKSVGIEPVFAVEGDGKYRADWAWLGGQGSVINPKFNAPDGPICEALREAGGLLAASADYKHSYPHSWRSKAKVIYRCTPQWFVPMDKEITPPPSAAQTVPLPVYASQKREGSGPSHFAEPNGKVAARSADGGVSTLRERAMAAISATRWVPEKGENRIRSMVEGRPDWVLSRQRAWGVPITLFVKKGTNQYLADPAVNARIVAAVMAGGVDAWSESRAQEYLGSDYSRDDYERVTDILDVWFDSGSTHAFVLESGRWPDLTRPQGYEGPLADIYLEGSDQHRGWFQSSLLEACATRGHAPYKAVLTHGFTMDQKGMKMSKSLGNTVDPLKVMETYGADIVRLWALSVDFTEDHRIGDEILKGVADQYRKLRNTFRYLLGALDGFSEAERVSVEAMPELERYVLALLAQLDATLRKATDDFDFNTYVRALTDFCNEDLSAFFFDIRKDSLYCDAADDPKRMAYRTVLDTLFHALIRYAAPVLVFTSEEVWGTRFAEGGSVHLLEWPIVDAGWNEQAHFDDDPTEQDVTNKWGELRLLRRLVSERIEPMRREKLVGSSLEVDVEIWPSQGEDFVLGVDLAELFITSSARVVPFKGMPSIARASDISAEQLVEMKDYEEERLKLFSPLDSDGSWIKFIVTRTTHHKCGRCWRHLPEVTEDGALCSRCDQVVRGMEAAE